LRIFYLKKKGQLSTNYEKIIRRFVVLSIAFAGSGTILPVVREITRIKKVQQTQNFLIKSGMCRWLNSCKYSILLKSYNFNPIIPVSYNALDVIIFFRILQKQTALVVRKNGIFFSVLYVRKGT